MSDRPLDENPYADWSAHLFVADRTQYILLTNTRSLYSVVMYGRGITNDGQFIDRALENIRQFMADDGLAFLYHQFIMPSTSTVSFAKALNRSVIGSMNELILHATDWLTEGEGSPHDVGFAPLLSRPIGSGPLISLTRPILTPVRSLIGYLISIENYIGSLKLANMPGCTPK